MDQVSKQTLLFYLLSIGVFVWCVALSVYLAVVDSRRRTASLAKAIASFGALLAALGRRLRQKGQFDREHSASTFS